MGRKTLPNGVDLRDVGADDANHRRIEGNLSTSIPNQRAPLHQPADQSDDGLSKLLIDLPSDESRELRLNNTRTSLSQINHSVDR